MSTSTSTSPLLVFSGYVTSRDGVVWSKYTEPVSTSSATTLPSVRYVRVCQGG